MTFAFRRAAGALIGSGALVVSPLAAAPASAEVVDIQIIGINDFHGRIEPLDDNDTPDDLTDDTGGAAMLAGALNAMEALNPNTVFVSAGDNVGASTFVSAVAEDAPTIEVLNAMGLDAGAVGNHEFDRGYDWLADPATHGVDGTGFAGWPTLGANVEGESPEMPEYEVVTVGGVDVGFVGAVTEQTASLVSPDGIAGITFTDPVAAANRVAGELTDGDAANGEADIVVLLVHEGSSADTCAAVATEGAFGEIVTGASADIAAIISGHTHNQYACEFDYAGGTRPVLQTGQYGEAFDRIVFQYDTVTEQLTLQTAEVLPTTGYTPDTDVAAIVAAAVAEAEVIGQQPVGEITQDITRAFRLVDGEWVEDRGSESVLGNFIADVQLAATADPGLGGAQIAFMNPGGLRADFCMAADVTECPEPTQGDGVVTYAEAATVQPFANGVVTMTLTGAQIKEVLEQQWQPEGASRPFLALGLSDAFFYTYDPDAPRGEHITSITLDGAPIDAAGEYRVTVNSFLAAGGDNFTTLAEGTERLDTGFNDLNVLVEYYEENSPITPDTESRRAVQALPAAQARAVDDSCTAAVTEDGFVDVPSSNPFEAVVDCLAYWGITKGTSATTYSPGSAVTRGQMAAFIARLIETSGGTLPAGTDMFWDDETSVFEDEINQLAAAGVVNGTGVGTYSPQLLVTRGQMAKFLVLAYEYRATEEGLDGITADADYFPDDSSSWAEAWINAAATVGFTGGHVDGTYRPDDAVRRDHMAAFLTRVLDLMVENGLTEVPASAL